ncbi:hypothetical protein BABINDRAFT_163324 [Babjeviella inositovora NRRL Y-12698]|uniref:Uncharacterized protein n=1 Tax=Babjeviella inositovora NRRL Y-12698 TaxID=984486 RepID=A0A1E3QIS6_9ASCO|nr:uncharacterized protein BABINDRAFT_163324 [Babjeviella inositovora NRRL Y-12698]ODQ77595.1 hypothetical protein BABINDRAFT_163324 [Babjeviella inositovora NRRL Y-12698]
MNPQEVPKKFKKPIPSPSSTYPSSAGAGNTAPRAPGAGPKIPAFFLKMGGFYSRMSFPEKMFLWGSTMALSYLGMRVTGNENEKVELRQLAEAQVEREMAEMRTQK